MDIDATLEKLFEWEPPHSPYNKTLEKQSYVTLNKETTVFNLQNMFRHSHVIFSCKWALTVVHLNFCVKVRYKITL